MGGFLVIKLVNPTKIFCSWTPDQGRMSHFLTSETKAHIGAAAARILRESNSAVRKELSRLNPTDRVLDKVTEFLALAVCDGRPEVLNFDHSLPHEDHPARPRGCR
jgi:hypothetical protein